MKKAWIWPVVTGLIALAFIVGMVFVVRYVNSMERLCREQYGSDYIYSGPGQCTKVVELEKR